MNETRKSGFYWCLTNDEWIVCRYWENDEWWDIPGGNSALIYIDGYFDQIDERPIVREEPKSE